MNQKSPNAKKYGFERGENGNKNKQANDKSKYQKHQHLENGEDKNLLQKNCECVILFTYRQLQNSFWQ